MLYLKSLQKARPVCYGVSREADDVPPPSECAALESSPSERADAADANDDAMFVCLGYSVYDQHHQQHYQHARPPHAAAAAGGGTSGGAAASELLLPYCNGVELIVEADASDDALAPMSAASSSAPSHLLRSGGNDGDHNDDAGDAEDAGGSMQRCSALASALSASPSATSTAWAAASARRTRCCSRR
jgi:hypothetical protein